MIQQVIPKTVTFDQFIVWYPENSEHYYELHNGIIVKMAQPLGEHEEVIGFLASELTAEFRIYSQTSNSQSTR